MSLIEFLVTYVAVGAAFAMRSYFRNRHRPLMSVIRAVAFELVIWLPKWVAVSIRRSFLGTAVAAPHPGRRPVSEFPRYETRIDDLMETLDSTARGKRVRETAEMYVALRSALISAETEAKPTGQFQLFDIAGHLNGRAGSACLFRKNLEKLRRHSQQAADELIARVAKAGPSGSRHSTVTRLVDLFGEFEDDLAINKTAHMNAPLPSEREALATRAAAEAACRAPSR